HQSVRPRPHHRLRRRRPVPEGQETYLLHPTTNSAATSGIPTAELGGTRVARRRRRLLLGITS
ncbi:MAG TPA: hypothetical protein VGL46_24645, partial [Pseudonocardiaceae bacterium]